MCSVAILQYFFFSNKYKKKNKNKIFATFSRAKISFRLLRKSFKRLHYVVCWLQYNQVWLGKTTLVFTLFIMCVSCSSVWVLKGDFFFIWFFFIVIIFFLFYFLTKRLWKGNGAKNVKMFCCIVMNRQIYQQRLIIIKFNRRGGSIKTLIFFLFGFL